MRIRKIKINFISTESNNFLWFSILTWILELYLQKVDVLLTLNSIQLFQQMKRSRRFYKYKRNNIKLFYEVIKFMVLKKIYLYYNYDT